MVEEWAFVDDDPIVLNVDIDEMIEDLENNVEENEIKMEMMMITMTMIWILILISTIQHQ